MHAMHAHHTKNALLEFAAVTVLSIFALFVAVFSTDWILGNGKNSNSHTGRKDNARPGIYAFMDIMDELDKKRLSNGSNPPAIPPEREYNNSDEVVEDYVQIMASLDNNGKKNAQ